MAVAVGLPWYHNPCVCGILLAGIQGDDSFKEFKNSLVHYCLGRQRRVEVYGDLRGDGAPSSPVRVLAHGGRDPGKPAWPEHFSRSGGMSLSANHSSSLLFTNAFDSVLILIRF